MYAEPGWRSEVARLPRGAELIVIKQPDLIEVATKDGTNVEKWLKVRWRDRVGWIFAPLVREIGKGLWPQPY